ncbi:hypothetical protein NDU88_004876 [Pleurodeles waltl]|uniref:Uncharacterized protein n=1 Tax=Pleurodeles waltl TaxID=8319 RepID=A0AAV7WAD2_PLEWA|nr:hypothetical protein NDU88_004876 [Pleurodeles waltl]
MDEILEAECCTMHSYSDVALYSTKVFGPELDDMHQMAAQEKMILKPFKIFGNKKKVVGNRKPKASTPFEAEPFVVAPGSLQQSDQGILKFKDSQGQEGY